MRYLLLLVPAIWTFGAIAAPAVDTDKIPASSIVERWSGKSHGGEASLVIFEQNGVLLGDASGAGESDEAGMRSVGDFTGYAIVTPQTIALIGTDGKDASLDKLDSSANLCVITYSVDGRRIYNTQEANGCQTFHGAGFSFGSDMEMFRLK